MKASRRRTREPIEPTPRLAGGGSAISADALLHQQRMEAEIAAVAEAAQRQNPQGQRDTTQENDAWQPWGNSGQPVQANAGTSQPDVFNNPVAVADPNRNVSIGNQSFSGNAVEPWDSEIYVSGSTLPNPYPPVKTIYGGDLPANHWQSENWTQSTPPTATVLDPWHEQRTDRNQAALVLQPGVEDFSRIPDQLDAARKTQQDYLASVPVPSWKGERYTQTVLPGTLLPENPTVWDQIKTGVANSLDYSLGGERAHYSKDVWTQRAPEEKYSYLNGIGKAAFAGTRALGDFLGHGTRAKFIWQMHPMDITNTQARNFVHAAGGNRVTQVLSSLTAAAALDAFGNNINLFNPGEGFRPAGYAATDPNRDDPSQTNNVGMEFINRGLLGRTGRLLPWEQFSQERPDVSYEQYAKYQDYLKESGVMGLLKGTTDGIEGPEVRLMGYRVSPLGAAAAAGVVGATVLGLKKGILPRRGM